MNEYDYKKMIDNFDLEARHNKILKDIKDKWSSLSALHDEKVENMKIKTEKMYKKKDRELKKKIKKKRRNNTKAIRNEKKYERRRKEKKRRNNKKKG
jgi:hypothetical protein